jgi:hypothetical protein
MMSDDQNTTSSEIYRLLLKLVIVLIPFFFALGVIAYETQAGMLDGKSLLPYDVAFGCALILWLLLQSATKKWIDEVTGYKEPEGTAPPSAEKQKFNQILVFTLLVGFVIYVWYSVVPDRTTAFNAFFSALTLGLAILIILIAQAYDEIWDRYIGLATGLSLSGIFLSVGDKQDFPAVSIFLIVAVPAGVAHAIWRWWGSQDFVKERRRQERYEAQQKQAQEAAARVAANLPPPPPPPPIPTIDPDGITDAARRIIGEEQQRARPSTSR